MINDKHSRLLMFSMPVAGVLTIINFGLFMAGCPAQQVACQVIRTADDVCTLIEYTDDAGVKHQEPVPAAELRIYAQELAARRAATARDAGKD